MTESAALDEAVPTPGPRSVAVVAVAVVALAAGVALGLLAAGGLLRPAVPAEGSADVGFARDMQTHHDQAVQMAVLVREGSEDEVVRTLALDMLLTQRQQQGQMFGWISTWGLPQASTSTMAWMGEEHHAAGSTAQDMPGMATQAQLDALGSAEGVEAERIFLSLMIPHHRGGVEMAEVALERAQQPEVVRLAESIVVAQEAEIAVLERMLDERGGPAEVPSAP
ncbi:DUF305 domain-containing protein [Actinotalea soli]|uniref:DUF305 domain-containing protein n=1 Tax=Actinotalea soli TaxID=2819234 RepID=UPI0027DCFB23|nr:DUF305 domain-containing protein [Actinotalea soli]